MIRDLQTLHYGLSTDEKIILVEENKILDWKKDVLLMMDYFHYDSHQKFISNAIVEYVERAYNIDTERKVQLLNMLNECNLNVNDILSELPFAVESKQSVEIADFMKILDIKAENTVGNSMQENIFHIIDIVAFTRCVKLVIMINLKMFLDQNELIEVYKYAVYNEVNILLVEGKEIGEQLELEKLLCIDKDFFESVK